MPIEVEGDDGTIYEVNTNDERVARQAVRRHLAEQRATLPQRQRAAERALRRQALRDVFPGFGMVAQPFADLLSDPISREEAGQSIARGMDWISSQLHKPLDLPRLGRDTGAAAQRAWNDLPNLPGRVWNNLPQIARGLSYGPWEDAEHAARERDLAREMGDIPAARNAAREGNEATLHAGVNTAAPLMGGGKIIQSGLTAAALTAPFALANGEGDLQERLPQALVDTAGAGLFGAGLAGALRAIPGATRAAPETVNAVDAFDRANVPPTFAAARGKEAAPFTMAIAENPIGGNVRRNLDASVTATADEAQRLAGEYGTPLPRESAGEAVQAGVRRWGNEPVEGPTDFRGAYATPSRDWSFNSKASQLYQHVEGRIEAMEEQALGRGGGQPAIGRVREPLTVVDNARAVLNEITGAVRNDAIRSAVADRDIVRFAKLVNKPGGRVHFGDLRALRTHVRELQSNPQFRQGPNNAALQRLEAALTADIEASARNIGGPAAGHLMRRVDTFYRAGIQRINRALKPFADERTSPGAAYDRIVQLASESGARANTRSLLALKRTLRPDEFRTVQASVINRLGRVKKGATNALEEGAFSIDNFVTNYADLSPQGRRILFGGMGGGATDTLASALDNLAYVAGRQKAVRGFSNFSRSGTSVQNMGTLAAGAGAVMQAVGGNYLPLGGFLLGVVTARVMGEALTNPKFVRWLIAASGAAKTGRSWSAHLPKLAALAAADPAVEQVYLQLQERAQQQQPEPQRSPAPYPQEQLQPAQ